VKSLLLSTVFISGIWITFKTSFSDEVARLFLNAIADSEKGRLCSKYFYFAEISPDF